MRPSTPRKSIDSSTPLSPAQIALPDSRPSTPLRAAFGGEDVPAPSPTAVSFAGAGAPPPLPKRAAKRVSIVGGQGSRPVTPVTPRVEEQEEDEKDEKKENETKQEEGEDEMSEVEAKTAPTTPAADEESEENDGNKELGGTLAEEDIGKADEVKESDKPVLNGDTHASPIEGEVTMPTPNDEEKKAEPTSPNPRVSEELPVNHTNEPEEDEGAFVGDATWEERTYKEIVKLREQLFWARVGVEQRQPQQEE